MVWETIKGLLAPCPQCYAYALQAGAPACSPPPKADESGEG